MSGPPPGLCFVYFAPADIQIARVDRNCIVKFCEAMQAIGAGVTLVSTRIHVLDSEPTRTRSTWDVFGVEHRFELVSVRLPLRQKRLETRCSQLVLKAARASVFPIIAAHLLLRGGRSHAVTVAYAKNYGLLPGLLFIKWLLHASTLVLFEAHVPPRTAFQKWVVKKTDGIVCNGHAIRRVLIESGVVRADRSISVHQGFSETAYPTGDRRGSRRAARLRLGWTQTENIAVYTGKVYWQYTEIDLLLQAAAQLASSGARVVLIGGREDHAQRWREETKRRGLANVAFVGFVAPSEVMDYQIAADVLLAYYPSDIATKDYLSPGKLFEYMASGTPIVAADFPSLREVLQDGHNALLVEPGRPDLLTQAVRRLMTDSELAVRLGHQARQDVSQYTWRARAEGVHRFIASLEHT